MVDNRAAKVNHFVSAVMVDRGTESAGFGLIREDIVLGIGQWGHIQARPIGSMTVCPLGLSIKRRDVVLGQIDPPIDGGDHDRPLIGLYRFRDLQL